MKKPGLDEYVCSSSIRYATTYGVDRPCRFAVEAASPAMLEVSAAAAAALPPLDCAAAAVDWPAETGTETPAAAAPRGGGGVATSGLPTAVPCK